MDSQGFAPNDQAMASGPNKTIKCVVVGDGAVGKTCLLISYTTNKFPSEYIPTVFDNYAVTVILVSRPSFENVRTKWIPEVKHHCPDTPCLIVGTQYDRWLASQSNTSSIVAAGEGQKLVNSLNDATKGSTKLYAYIECSALTQYRLKDVFDEAITIALSPQTTGKKKTKLCILL